MTSTVLQQPSEESDLRVEPRHRRGIDPALLAAVLTGVVVFLAYLPFLRINPDPHHDGLVLKTAVDVAEGQTLYVDTFDQYGPLFVAVNAIAVKIFGGEIIVLRLLCAGMLATTAGLVVWAARMFLSPLLAAASVLLWLVLDPTLRGAAFLPWGRSFLPWSSIHVLFWSAVVLTCLIEPVHRMTRRRAIVFGAIGGLALAATTLSRTATGVATAGAVSLALLIRHRYLDRVRLRELAAWLTALLTPFVAFGIWLVVAGAARDFREQMITLPRKWYTGSAIHGNVPGASGDREVWDGFIDAALRVGLLSAIIVGAIVVLRGRQTRSKVIGGATAAIAGALALTIRDPSVNDVLEIEFSAIYQNGPAFVLPIIAVAGLVAVVVICQRRRARTTVVGGSEPTSVEAPERSFVARNTALAAASCVGLAGVVQYYPVGDSRHLFWGVALVIPPAVGALYLLGGRVLAWVLVAACCIALVPSAVQQGHAELSITRRPAPERVGPLAHMLLTNKEWKTWGRDLRDLATLLSRHPDAPILLFGPDPLPATVASNLANPSPYFAEWGPLRYPTTGGIVSVAPPRNRQAIDRFVERERPIVWFARGNPKIDGFLRRHRYRTLHETRRSCDVPEFLFCPVIAVPREWQPIRLTSLPPSVRSN